MLWQYTEVMFAVAGLATILSFHKSIDRFGQIFFIFVGALFWNIFGISLLKINFKWGGSTSVVDYTYIPGAESPFIYAFMFMGLVMFLIGLIRALELTYQPVIDYTAKLTGHKTNAWERED